MLLKMPTNTVIYNTTTGFQLYSNQPEHPHNCLLSTQKHLATSLELSGNHLENPATPWQTTRQKP